MITDNECNDVGEASPYRLVFDTETNGFPKSGIGSMEAGQSVVVELGASLVDTRDWKVQQRVSLIISTPSPEIPGFLVTDVHGISNELSVAIGVDAKVAVDIFVSLAKSANWQLVGHNVEFDIKMMKIMLERTDNGQYVHDLMMADVFCTMNRSTNIVRCPPTPAMIKAGRGGTFKVPKLEQAYEHFAGEPMTGAHRAGDDVNATLFIYRKLMEGDF
jgi:DNA polymerase III epsilon subunit-like protein